MIDAKEPKGFQNSFWGRCLKTWLCFASLPLLVSSHEEECMARLVLDDSINSINDSVIGYWNMALGVIELVYDETNPNSSLVYEIYDSASPPEITPDNAIVYEIIDLNSDNLCSNPYAAYYLQIMSFYDRVCSFTSCEYDKKIDELTDKTIGGIGNTYCEWYDRTIDGPAYLNF